MPTVKALKACHKQAEETLDLDLERKEHLIMNLKDNEVYLPPEWPKKAATRNTAGDITALSGTSVQEHLRSLCKKIKLSQECFNNH